jgi:hypothetical protein
MVIAQRGTVGAVADGDPQSPAFRVWRCEEHRDFYETPSGELRRLRADD